MKLLAEGFTATSIAERLNVSRRVVMAWRDSPEGAEDLAQARAEREQEFRDTFKEARDKLKSLSLRAVEVLAKQLDSGDEDVAGKAARTVLDRVGLPRTERHELVPQREDLSRLSDDEVEALRALRAKLEG